MPVGSVLISIIQANFCVHFTICFAKVLAPPSFHMSYMQVLVDIAYTLLHGWLYSKHCAFLYGTSQLIVLQSSYMVHLLFISHITELREALTCEISIQNSPAKHQEHTPDADITDNYVNCVIRCNSHANTCKNYMDLRRSAYIKGEMLTLNLIYLVKYIYSASLYLCFLGPLTVRMAQSSYMNVHVQ